MTFPAVQGTTAVSGSGTSSTSFAVSLPSGIVAGELLLMHVATNSFTTLSTPAGWNLLATNVISGQLLDYVFSRTANGSEGSTVTVSSGSSAAFEAVVRRINNWGSVEVSAWSVAASNVTSITPNAITPSWGALDSLFFIIGSTAGGTSGITYPTGYSVDQQSVTTSGAHRSISAGKTNTATTETPGSVSWSASSNAQFLTVAIKRAPTTTTQSVSAALATTVAFVRGVGKRIAATASSTLAVVKSVTRALLATSSTAVAAARSAGKGFAGSISTTTSLVRQVGKVVAATATIATVIAAIHAILVTITVAASTATTIFKQATKVIAATLTSATSIPRLIGKIAGVSASASVVIVAVRAYLITVSAALSTGVSMIYPKHILTTLSATIATNTIVVKSARKSFLLSVTAATTTKRYIAKLVSLTASSLVNLRRLSSRFGKAVRSILLFWH